MTAAAPPLDPRNPVVPFTLEVGGKPLYAQTLLRHLPGKRIVVAGEWDGRQIVAKIYIDPKRAHVHAAREAAGMKAMADRGVATARLLLRADNCHVRILLFEFLGNTETALHQWQTARTMSEKRALLNALVRTVGDLHTAGLLQEDLHLRNFLIRGDRVYTLDGASIRIRRTAVSFSTGLDNLALLFAQLDQKDDAHIEAAYKEYCAQIHRRFSQKEVMKLRHLVKRRRERRARDYFTKIFRSCSAFESSSNSKRFWVVDRRYDSTALREFLERPDDFLGDARNLKDGRSSTVMTVRIDGRQLLIKRYNLKDPWHAFKRAIRRTRAAISWRNAHLLQLGGFATPQPVALLESRCGFLKRVSYFITEYVDAPDCYHLIHGGTLSTVETESLIERMAELFARFFEHHLVHGDTKATNFLVDTAAVYTIDLDALRQYRSGWRGARGHRADVARFLQNWDGAPEIKRKFADRMLSLRA